MTDPDINAHTLRIRALELKAPVPGPAGPTGPTGPTGPQGPTGAPAPIPANATSGFYGNLNFNQDALAVMTFAGISSILGLSTSYVGPYALVVVPYSVAGNLVTVQLMRVSNGELIPNQIHTATGVAWGPHI